MEKLTFIGNLTADPQRHTLSKSGKDVIRFTVAVNRKIGENKITHFYNVSAFGKAGQVIERYFSKGSGIYIEGDPDYSVYTDRSGKPAISVNVLMSSFDFIGNSKPAEQKQEQPISTPAAYAAVDIDPDDIPF